MTRRRTSTSSAPTVLLMLVFLAGPPWEGVPGVPYLLTSLKYWAVVNCGETIRNEAAGRRSFRKRGAGYASAAGKRVESQRFSNRCRVVCSIHVQVKVAVGIKCIGMVVSTLLAPTGLTAPKKDSINMKCVLTLLHALQSEYPRCVVPARRRPCRSSRTTTT